LTNLVLSAAAGLSHRISQWGDLRAVLPEFGKNETEGGWLRAKYDFELKKV
jgi:hypothetical protein